MNEDQQRALDEFRAWIKDNNITDHPQFDDYYLLRFLRARKFDMEKTKLMFTNFINWRRDNDVDNVITVSRSTRSSNQTVTIRVAEKRPGYSDLNLINLRKFPHQPLINTIILFYCFRIYSSIF